MLQTLQKRFWIDLEKFRWEVELYRKLAFFVSGQNVVSNVDFRVSQWTEMSLETNKWVFCSRNKELNGFSLTTIGRPEK
jgi:hypothetical protein